jgi:hypothetical protein
VRALCTSASLPKKTQTVNIIVRTLGPDRAAMGRIYLRSAGSVFDNLKNLSALSIKIATSHDRFDPYIRPRRDDARRIAVNIDKLPERVTRK